MTRSEDHDLLVTTSAASSYHQADLFTRRSRKGHILVFAAFMSLLTGIFYLCSLDYEALTLEKKLISYHQALLKEQVLMKVRAHNGLMAPHPAGSSDLSFSGSSFAQSVQEVFNHKNVVSPFDMDANDVLVLVQIPNTGISVLENRLTHDLLLRRPCVCHKKRCSCFKPEAIRSGGPSFTSSSQEDEDMDGADADKEADIGGSAKDNRFWLFSRATVGWACGLRPDWTELTSCVDPTLDRLEHRARKRRYFYATILRDPIKRFLSEFYKKQSSPITPGVTSDDPNPDGGDPDGHESSSTVSPVIVGETRKCGGRYVTVPSCDATSLDSFLGCDTNLALNRQTRMLADLSLVHCYNHSQGGLTLKERDVIMLSSAKRNLHRMGFFGIGELPHISQSVLEQTFGWTFGPDTDLVGGEGTGTGAEASAWTGGADKVGSLNGSLKMKRAGNLMEGITPDQVDTIRRANHLDVQLYEYARDLLFHRFNQLSRARDRDGLAASPSGMGGTGEGEDTGGVEDSFVLKQEEMDNEMNWGEKEDQDVLDPNGNNLLPFQSPRADEPSPLAQGRGHNQLMIKERNRPRKG